MAGASQRTARDGRCTPPRFSSRTAWQAAESSYAVEVREASDRGQLLLDLTGSNPTCCGIEMDGADLLKAFSGSGALTYDPQPLGLVSARRAVAAYYADHDAEIDPGSILLTASTSESYSFLFRLLCDPGDEVLVAVPSYPLFDLLAQLDDVRLKTFPVFFDHGWWIDFGELERRITARTRAILVVHPNNPTGHWTAASERIRLEELCAARGLALIVDEVFLDYGLDPLAGAPSTFAAGPHPALTFVLSGLSKIVALPQMKAAWMVMAGPEQLRTEALRRLEIVADTFLSVSTPVQLALPAWLAGRRTIQEKILARVRGSLGMLREFAHSHPESLRVIEPAAGWTAVLSVARCGGDPDCAAHLVRELGIVLHPGEFYGMGEPNRAVASLLTPPETLARALGRL